MLYSGEWWLKQGWEKWADFGYVSMCRLHWLEELDESTWDIMNDFYVLALNNLVDDWDIHLDEKIIRIDR